MNPLLKKISRHESLMNETNINYEGFSGPVDLNPDGKVTTSEFVVFEFGPDGDTYRPDGVGDFFLLDLAPTLTDPSEPPADLATACRVDIEGIAALRKSNGVISELLVALANYGDVLITSDEYLAESDRLLPQLEQGLEELEGLEACLPSEVWLLFEPFVGTYRHRLNGYWLVEDAIRLDSGAAYGAGLEMIRDAVAEQTELGCALDNPFPESLGLCALRS